MSLLDDPKERRSETIHTLILIVIGLAIATAFFHINVVERRCASLEKKVEILEIRVQKTNYHMKHIRPVNIERGTVYTVRDNEVLIMTKDNKGG